MSSNEPVTISFPPGTRKTAKAKAKANGETFSGYLVRLVREDFVKHGISPDLPDEELQKKMAEWFEKHGVFDEEKKARKPRKKNTK